jgi:hypothetical protein
VNLNVPQGSCSLEEIFEQVRQNKLAYFWHVFRKYLVWLGHQLSWLRSFVGFLSPFRQATHWHILSLWVGCFMSLSQHFAGCRVRDIVLALASCLSFCVHKRINVAMRWKLWNYTVLGYWNSKLPSIKHITRGADKSLAL